MLGMDCGVCFVGGRGWMFGLDCWSVVEPFW